ncbi:caspase family protein [Leptospira venezuelensis]|uniref:caspase family protein n=1 Tax=Leptospira venezuelensis TaxID=1958811 RepID=UPI000A35E1A0|nr:caspase family protein [Leptospira venezuelensis]
MRIFLIIVCSVLSFGLIADELKFHPSWKESSGVITFTDLGDGRIASALENKTILVWSLSDRKYKVFSSNTSIVSTIAHSPKSGRLVYQSDESRIKILSANLETWADFPDSLASVSSFDFSPDGLSLASGDENGKVRIRDTKGKPKSYFYAHNDPVTAVQFTPDGKYIITSSEDGQSILWTREGTKIKILETRQSPILCAKISPDGTKLISGGDDGKIKEIDILTGKISDLGRHTSSVRSLSYSKNGKYILSASEDLTAKIWDSKGNLKNTFTGHSDTVNKALFINDEKQVLTGSDDGTHKIFDLNGKELANIVLTDKGKVVFDPKGRFDYDSETLESYFYFNSEEEELHFGAETFYNIFFSPGLIHKIFKGDSENQASVSDLLHTSPPPKIELELVPSEDKKSVFLNVKVCDEGGGIGDLNLYHNDSLILSETSRSVRIVSQDHCIRKTYTPELSPGENHFRISGSSKAGLLSYSKVHSFYKPFSSERLPKLHLILLAVDDYQGKQMDLKYAVKDAIAVSSSPAFKKQNIFSSTETYSAYDREADKKGILSTFQEVSEKANPEDLVFIFIAGHGTNKNEKFYFLTSGFDPENPDLEKSGFSQEEFVLAVSKIKATRKLLMFDTCDSGGEWTTQFKELGNLAKSAGLYVMSSTSEKEEAYESSALEHGVFTTAVLEGLQGKALTNGKITASSLIAYINLRVPEIAKSIVKKEQYPYSSQRGRDFVISE